MLLVYAKNYWSQNGEDGIIEEIFKRLGINGGWLCEFGAGDGKTISNSYHWISSNKNFKVLYIENGDEDYERILKVVDEHPDQIIALKETVTPQNINELLSRSGADDFEMISIDIDSHDYAVWEALTEFKPKVVIIEINSSLLPGEYQIHDDEKNLQGNSFTSTVELGKRKGYTAVAHTGNLIFVRNDLVDKVLIPDDFFVWNWVDLKTRSKVTDKMIIINHVHST